MSEVDRAGLSNRGPSVAAHAVGVAFDPADWWRTLCWVTDRIIVTGDLPSDPVSAAGHLDAWTAAGVTHVVDVRGERSDLMMVADLAPHLTYLWAPTHDHGGAQPDEWFDRTVGWVLDVLADDADAVVLIHCHMGVNRAPSLTMAVLLSLGFSSLDALDAIRSARPIARILYADQAVDWYHRAIGSPVEVRWADRASVDEWHDRNQVDGSWIISRIARRDVDESWGARW